MEIEVQRKVEIWVAETYNIEEYNEEILEKILAYDDIYPDEVETLWDTQEEIGPYMVIDIETNKILEDESGE